MGSLEIVRQALHQKLHPDGCNKKTENLGKHGTDGFPEKAIYGIDKVQDQPGNADHRDHRERRDKEAIFRISEKYGHHSPGTGQNGASNGNGSNMIGTLLVSHQDTAYERSENQMINRYDQKQQSPCCHQVVDADLKELSQDVITGEDEDKEDNAGGDRAGSKGPAPLRRRHSACQL